MTVNRVRCGLAALSLIMPALFLAGCGSTRSADVPDYYSAGERPPLDVPPDLVTPTSSDRYQVPAAGAGTTLSAYQREQQKNSSTTTTATPRFVDISLERTGQLRWLKVNRPPDEVWQQVREFWQESGFLISEESPDIGVMQTDWAEKTAQVSGGLIRDTLSRVFGTRYSTSERDAFRARLEPVDGGTEVYISHRGMEEVITEERDGGTKWQPRPTDHELEVEFLRRLMTFLGSTEEQANNAVAATNAPTQSLSELVSADSGSVLRLREGFDRAWRRVGLALDRGSFTVEDRNRAAGTYYVRYIDSDLAREKPGVFGRLFGSKEPEQPKRYRIVVAASGTESDVSVLAAQDAPEPASDETTRRMLTVIQEKLGR